VTDVWSGRADAYRTAVEQREGDDLDRIVEWCGAGGALTALDVATGGGHVARRLREAGLTVTTLDPAPGMRPDVVSGAESIPFADGCFDAVVTRIAPHHFADVPAAVAEMARVACALVMVEDTLYASEEVEEAERLRDPTHVRSYTEDEWRRFFGAAGLDVEVVELFEKRHPLEAWLARTGCEGEEADRVRELLADRTEGDEYVDTKILLRARKGASS
jgi:SAM-dependent methyltransferase